MQTRLFFLVLGLSSSALAQSGTMNAANTEASAASELYERGLEHVRAKEFAAAAADFEAAFQADPRPTVLYSLGLAFAADERPVEAVRTLTQYLESAGEAISVERRRLVNEVLVAQNQRIGSLLIEAPAGITVSIDERRIGETPLDQPILLSDRTHTIGASRIGFVSMTRTVQIKPQATATLELKLVPEAPSALTPGVNAPVPGPATSSSGANAARGAPPHHSGTHAKDAHQATYRALGVGAATGAVISATLGTLFALRAHSTEQQLNDANVSGARWHSSLEAEETSGRRAQYAAWGCFAAAGVFAGAATWLLVWPPSSKRTSNDLAVEVSGHGVALKGAFNF